MTTLLRLLAGLAGVLLLGACGSSSPSSATAGDEGPTLPLGHAGRWITDAQGRVVILHGMNMMLKKAPYTPQATGFDEDDGAFLAAEGYNAVRVGIIYKGLEPQPGVYDEHYLDQIADTVAMLGRHGLVSLLDFHQDQYNESFNGEGFPDWAVISDGIPNEKQLGYIGNPALLRAYDNFWNNAAAPDGSGLQDHFAAAWQHVAQRFAGNREVFGYEILNEPYPGTEYPTCFVPLGCPLFDARLTAAYQRVIPAIRRADPSNLVWFEPNLIFDFGANTLLGRIADPQAGFSFHVYCIPGIPLSGCSLFFDRVFGQAETYAASGGHALLVTEAGAVDDAAILQLFVDKADANRTGWLEWDYCTCDDPAISDGSNPYGIVADPHQPPSGDNIKPAKLAVLSRPYPKVVAGTPLSYAFDAASKAFRLDYSTRRADGGARFDAGARTVVALPARQYPRGYTVQLGGARVTSADDAAQLVIESLPGADEVRLTVTPRAAP